MNPAIVARTTCRIGRFAVTATLAATLVASGAFGQTSTPPSPPSSPVAIPKEASSLEGRPTVMIDSTAAGSTRRELGVAEGSDHRLAIKVVDGRLFWASQGNIPLTMDTVGGYTYLSSGPGRYVRLSRVNDRISYVEHLDTAPGHVTFWGELRIVLGR